MIYFGCFGKLPDNLKTSVNPVKTLTPRFITRTLEEYKKKNAK